MSKPIVEPTNIRDALIIHPVVHEDDRGFFKQTYSTIAYSSLNIADVFVQDSVSFSSKNVLRGLHGDPQMSKLVQVLRGRVFDVIVDIRKDSPTYLKWQGFYLSEHNHMQLYVPRGCLNGFYTQTDDVVFSYKHGALHNPKRELAFHFSSMLFAIQWPFDGFGPPFMSRKDKQAPAFTSRDSV